MEVKKHTAKAIIALAAAFVLVTSVLLTPARAAESAYTDVSPEDWYYSAVEYMSANGYMSGYSSTTFAPNDTLSRAMFVTILYRVSGEKADANGTKFTDVPENIWYSEAVAWAVANGITSGTSDTTFSPDAPVTREQLAAFLKRYIDNKNITVSDAFTITTAPSDVEQSSAWAKDAVRSMYRHGILLGSDRNAYPKNNATRIETAMAFYNFLCLAKKTNSQLLLSGDYYAGSIDISCKHNWATKHYDEIGGYKYSETHKVRHFRCRCGFAIDSDVPNADELWTNHGEGGICLSSYWYWDEDVPTDPEWVVYVPAYDVVYCTFCGMNQ